MIVVWIECCLLFESLIEEKVRSMMGKDPTYVWPPHLSDLRSEN